MMISSWDVFIFLLVRHFRENQQVRAAVDTSYRLLFSFFLSFCLSPSAYDCITPPCERLLAVRFWFIQFRALQCSGQLMMLTVFLGKVHDICIVIRFQSVWWIPVRAFINRSWMWRYTGFEQDVNFLFQINSWWLLLDGSLPCCAVCLVPSVLALFY